MGYFLGIDLGTSSVKAVVANEYGEVKGTHKVDYNFYIPLPGYAEQDPQDWWNSTVEAIQGVGHNYGINMRRVEGIGFSGQMHGTVIIGKDYKPIGNAVIWCDQRTIDQVRQIYDTVGRKTLGRITLNPLATGFQLATLLWIKQNQPEIYDKCYKVILPKDYIRLKITGELGTDITDASSTSAFDAVNLRWSEEIIGKVGLDIDKYPPIGLPYEIAGYVSSKAAEETGLKPGVPVVFGGGDQPMQAVGNGIIFPGTISCTILALR